MSYQDEIKNKIFSQWRIIRYGMDEAEFSSGRPDVFTVDNFSVTQLTQDSRDVCEKSLFVAITCDQVISHIQSAMKAHPVAVVVEESVFQANRAFLPKGIYILVDHARLALSQLASFVFPAQPDQIYAVTGTNGKSSVVTFVRQIIGQLGTPVVSLGTVGMELSPLDRVPEFWERLKNESKLPKLTTPDAVSLHRVLSMLKQAGVDHFVFEASSHGLEQYRLHCVRVTVAAFTNLTQDHLDYHGTMESYFEAKAKLFTQILKDKGTAILNAGSPHSRSLALLLAQREISIQTYGVEVEADLVATTISLTSNGISFDLVWKGQSFGRQNLFLVGEFQLENVLCATLMAVAGGGYDIEDVISTYPLLKSAKGRMELVGTTDEGAMIYVDYAHTPDALLRALQALRLHLEENAFAQLHLVFGCGGNRDVSKRHLMGDIAHRFADQVIVTDDNPRDEDPAYIRAQILSQCIKGREIPDRQEAIAQAIAELGPKDILLIAGKGHEQGQIVRDQILPFDDAQIVQQILTVSHNQKFKSNK